MFFLTIIWIVDQFLDKFDYLSLINITKMIFKEKNENWSY